MTLEYQVCDSMTSNEPESISYIRKAELRLVSGVREGPIQLAVSAVAAYSKRGSLQDRLDSTEEKTNGFDGSIVRVSDEKSIFVSMSVESSDLRSASRQLFV